MANDHNSEESAIRKIVEDWVIFSDAGDWERFEKCWHDDGWMSATWFQASASEFIEARRTGFDKGVSIIHFLGAFTCDIESNRAISQTKMTITQRAPVHDVLVDVLCTGRFFDFFEKRGGRWGMVRRQPIYEKDRMDPDTPGDTLQLDKTLLAQFPEGYRHLAYLQTQVGYQVKRQGMPGLKGPEVEQLYQEGRGWLAGAATAGTPL